MRDFRLTEHSKQVTSHGFFFNRSIFYGSIVGLDHKADKFIHEALNDCVPKSCALSEADKEIVDTLRSFNILECASILNETVISSAPYPAYLHITNSRNFLCYGCTHREI